MNGGRVQAVVTYSGIVQVAPGGWHCKFNWYATRTEDGVFVPTESGERTLDGVGGPVCTPANYDISLAGSKVTKALPAGPAVPQVATVRLSGSPASGRSVVIRANGAFYTSGNTDAGW